MSSIENAAALSMGYAWGREDEASGNPGPPSANVAAFAAAYTVASQIVAESGSGDVPPLQEAWQSWQESGHAAIRADRPATRRAGGP